MTSNIDDNIKENQAPSTLTPEELDKLAEEIDDIYRFDADIMTSEERERFLKRYRSDSEFRRTIDDMFELGFLNLPEDDELEDDETQPAAVPTETFVAQTRETGLSPRWSENPVVLRRLLTLSTSICLLCVLYALTISFKNPATKQTAMNPNDAPPVEIVKLQPLDGADSKDSPSKTTGEQDSASQTNSRGRDRGSSGSQSDPEQFDPKLHRLEGDPLGAPIYKYQPLDEADSKDSPSKTTGEQDSSSQTSPQGRDGESPGSQSDPAQFYPKKPGYNLNAFGKPAYQLNALTAGPIAVKSDAPPTQLISLGPNAPVVVVEITDFESATLDLTEIAKDDEKRRSALEAARKADQNATTATTNDARGLRVVMELLRFGAFRHARAEWDSLPQPLKDGVAGKTCQGALLYFEGKLDEAEQALRQAREIAPDDPIVARNLEFVQAAKESAEPNSGAF